VHVVTLRRRSWVISLFSVFSVCLSSVLCIVFVCPSVCLSFCLSVCLYWLCFCCFVFVCLAAQYPLLFFESTNLPVMSNEAVCCYRQSKRPSCHCLSDHLEHVRAAEHKSRARHHDFDPVFVSCVRHAFFLAFVTLSVFVCRYPRSFCMLCVRSIRSCVHQCCARLSWCVVVFVLCLFPHVFQAISILCIHQGRVLLRQFQLVAHAHDLALVWLLCGTGEYFFLSLALAVRVYLRSLGPIIVYYRIVLPTRVWNVFSETGGVYQSCDGD